LDPMFHPVPLFFSQWVAMHRQRSPVRRMDDPLPSPPLLDV
jgi:hypothetical protein